MKLYLLIGSTILAACGSASHVVGSKGGEVVVVKIKGETPFSELTSTRTITRALQLRSGCAYQYEEVVADSAGKQMDLGATESSFMIDTSGEKCSQRPSSWYVLIGPNGVEEVQRYADLVTRLMAGDYSDSSTTPSLKGKQPSLIEVNGDDVELSYVIPPYNYLVKVDVSNNMPRISESEKWQ